MLWLFNAEIAVQLTPCDCCHRLPSIAEPRGSRRLSRSSGLWRNGLVFDPYAKYGAWSWAEVMMYPLADALAQVRCIPLRRLLQLTHMDCRRTSVYLH